MSRPRVCVTGTGPLAATTAGCLATAGFSLVGVREADILWVCAEVPIDAGGHGHPEHVAAHLEETLPHAGDGALVLLSSPVPVGTTASVERRWRAARPSLRFAYSPENLRVASAAADFVRQPRVVVGLGDDTPQRPLAALFAPFTGRLLWMSLESAEMSKHALNGYLALSAAYANELARLSEPLGVDPADVERALRTDPRVGDRAYVAAAGPITGGHLVRDVHVLRDLAARQGIAAPLADAIIESDRLHAAR